VNNLFETHDKFHAVLRSMIQSKDSTETSEVEQEQTKLVKRGNTRYGKFMTYREQDLLRKEKKRQASQLLSDNRTFDVEGLKADKSKGNFGGVFKSFSEKELNNKLNGDEMGSSFVKMIVENKVKVVPPMATEAELKSFSKTGNFGGFSILQ
jgi:hypothetical protein